MTKQSDKTDAGKAGKVTIEYLNAGTAEYLRSDAFKNTKNADKYTRKDDNMDNFGKVEIRKVDDVVKTPVAEAKPSTTGTATANANAATTVKALNKPVEFRALDGKEVNDLACLQVREVLLRLFERAIDRVSSPEFFEAIGAELAKNSAFDFSQSYPVLRMDMMVKLKAMPQSNDPKPKRAVVSNFELGSSGALDSHLSAAVETLVRDVLTETGVKGVDVPLTLEVGTNTQNAVGRVREAIEGQKKKG